MTAKNHNPPAPDARAMVAQILTAATGLQEALEGGLQASLKGSSKPLGRRANHNWIAIDPDLQTSACSSRIPA